MPWDLGTTFPASVGPYEASPVAFSCAALVSSWDEGPGRGLASEGGPAMEHAPWGEVWEDALGDFPESLAPSWLSVLGHPSDLIGS